MIVEDNVLMKDQRLGGAALEVLKAASWLEQDAEYKIIACTRLGPGYREPERVANDNLG